MQADEPGKESLHAELARYRFITGLDDAIRLLTDPEQIAGTAARLLGEHLGADRCAYAYVSEDEGSFTLTGNYTNGLDSIVGRYQLAAFGAAFTRLNCAGLPYVVTDAEVDERVSDVLQAYRDTGIRAVISVPVIKGKRWVAGMALHQSQPREWQEHDIRLLEAVANRCWESIERSRIAIELRAAEERVRSSHDYLRLLVDCTEEGFYSVDRDGVTIMCNAAFLKMLGFRHEDEAIGKKLHDVIHHSHPDGSHYCVADCPIYRAAQFGVPAVIEDELFFRLDGSSFPVEYRARPVWRDGQLEGAVCTFVDLTQRRRTEDALRKSEIHLQSVFHQSAAGICETDLGGRILQVNDRYCEILGRTREELLAIRMQDITHPDDLAQNVPLFKRAVATGEAFEIEKRYLRPDGSFIWVSNTVSLIRVPGGPAVDSILAVCIDISKRKRAEEALREADRRKDEFLAMLAHELRNPMAPIRAAADLLETRELPPEQRRRTSQIISRQVRHMTGLVDDLLDVSRVTRGRVELQKTRLDAKQVIADAIEQTRPLMEAKRHRLVVELASDAAQVLGDHKRLVQVLSNLLNNAAKYTPAGGRITVTMGTSDAQVLLEVADNGIGIAPELQGRVFDLFAQADRSVDRSQGGLGIGLALVKSLVDLHGGSVICRSEGEGQGSRFIVTLPRAARQEAPVRAQEEAVPAVPAGRRRTLVVDDNVDAAQMLGMCLEAAGHEVMLEYSPLPALERARLVRPEICILDIGLPGIDGNELARRLRAQPETSGATLIALTGYGQEQDRCSALAAGFDHHLVKPVAAPELLALVAKASR
ncbi:PAS domain S-box protein [Massilia sp. IC2-476]|uniref:hybrid sensor histidine kinase/response regulator n=1 Tax=Massilia sp. IC2-476 TaxID=2887199 RepID=UPI001D10A780|nr:PAS domain S-box protein [Massilia sp. IC2-476]MCC2973140.1 PAS domain S-box protein [Massilia sp. IC2-476]